MHASLQNNNATYTICEVQNYLKTYVTICRWDVAAADSLPCYMRSCYKALYTVTNEMADMAENEHGLNPIDHLRKAVSCTHKYNISRILFG
jgi:hypothetical protein